MRLIEHSKILQENLFSFTSMEINILTSCTALLSQLFIIFTDLKPNTKFVSTSEKEISEKKQSLLSKILNFISIIINT